MATRAARPPRLRPGTAPPPGYYANNLLAVADHLQRHQRDVLGATAVADLRVLQALSTPAVRLLARLISRTTAVVRRDSLAYQEIDDTDQALQELSAAGMVQINPALGADAVLARLKVAELRDLFAVCATAPPGARTKSALIVRILSHHSDQHIRTAIATRLTWVNVRITDSLRRMLVAYFGTAARDFSQFVVRDLGLVAYESYPLASSCRAFASAAELRTYLNLHALQRLPQQRRAKALPWVLEYLDTVQHDLDANPSLVRRRNRLLLDWGRQFERGAQDGPALACYRRCSMHPAREREARMLRKLGADVALADVLQAIRATPYSPEETLFAQAFAGGRSRTATSAWSHTQWTAPSAPMPQVEAQVAATLSANGGQAWYVENALFCSLLGLAFWDIVFAAAPGMFTHPFQDAPRDLLWNDFRTRRAPQINARLAQCRDATLLWRHIDHTLSSKAGVACRLVHWGLLGTDPHTGILAAARRCFSATQLASVFDYMLHDLRQARTGLPDLFVAYGERFELVEVKGPGDQLQPNQRVWLRQLHTAGIPCRVIQLRAPP